MAAANDGLNGFDRHSLCIAGPTPGIACHAGDHGFVSRVARHYSSHESIATEQLIDLKRELLAADTETFWSKLMEGMTSICNAQYGFVSKRVLSDDHDSAVEMPPIGAVGSCLLGTAFYYNDGKNTKAMHRDYKYRAWDCPCAYMKHDKVFLIPENLSGFILNNPNVLPGPAEAYLGIPLFLQGKCFAHFGMMWSKNGLAQRHLSWPSVELIMHALEDLILARLLAGDGFAKRQDDDPLQKEERVIPHEAITPNQSLKPYARSLSHELRTPMQGVVGMLDVMHTNVQEAIDGLRNPKVRSILQVLKENLEVVEDSSRRAVEAADNVVHAVDLNMEVPETSTDIKESGSREGSLSDLASENLPTIYFEDPDADASPNKRRKLSPERCTANSRLQRSPVRGARRRLSSRSQSPAMIADTPHSRLSRAFDQNLFQRDATPNSHALQHNDIDVLPTESDACLTPNVKHSKIREVLHAVISDGLLLGGRPDSTSTKETELGEEIEVRSSSSNGQGSLKVIHWQVSQMVPQILPVDERDLSKLISCVFLNAYKFTELGSVTITVDITEDGRSVLTKVADTGMGIPQDFLPRLFKPFSRKDDSLTRSKEGLGLGLLVAKGLARKIGGDIRCVRSETSGPSHGSEFEIEIPLHVGSPIIRRDSSSTCRDGDSEAECVSPASERADKGVELNRGASSSPSPLQPSPESRQNSKSHLRSSSLSTAVVAPKAVSLPIPPNNALPSPVERKKSVDGKMADKLPLTFLVVEDSKINRQLLVTMLAKLGYNDVHEAFDGKEAVRVMKDLYTSLELKGSGTSPAKRTGSGVTKPTSSMLRRRPVDLILMDLWMPEMDGYEATQRIHEMGREFRARTKMDITLPTVLAVTADVTDEAIARATSTGMEGFMAKPFKLSDLQKLIEGFSTVRTDSRDRSPSKSS